MLSHVNITVLNIIKVQPIIFYNTPHYEQNAGTLPTLYVTNNFITKLTDSVSFTNVPKKQLILFPT